MYKKFLALVSVLVLLSTSFVVPVLAQTTTIAAPISPEALLQQEMACMKTAVDKRENAIQEALDVYYRDIRAVLVPRSSELSVAWTISDKDKRQASIKVSWAKSKGVWRNASKALSKAKVAIWKEFNYDRKYCGSVRNDEPKNEN